MGDVDVLTGKIIESALRIHSRFGPGLFESVYESILARALVQRGFRVERQKRICFEFEGLWFDDAGRADLVVNRQVIVEVKSVSELAPVHARQLLTYLRLLDHRIGLLINFNVLHLRDGIKRVINPYSDPSEASV